MKHCNVQLIWDEESDRWYTETDDVPGMHLDSGSLDALIEKVKMIAPDMLEITKGYRGPLSFAFKAERNESIRMPMADAI